MSGWELKKVSGTSTGAGYFMLEVACSSGKHVLGGGYTFKEMDGVDTKVYQSFPGTTNGWTVAIDDDGHPTTLTAYVICAFTS